MAEGHQQLNQNTSVGWSVRVDYCGVVMVAQCMYELPYFDSHFDPVVHNKYLARRAEMFARQEEQRLLEEALLCHQAS